MKKCPVCSQEVKNRKKHLIKAHPKYLQREQERSIVNQKIQFYKFKISDLITKAQRILNLEEEKFLIKKDLSIRYEACIDWDDKNNQWIISHKQNTHPYYFFHEVGHVYLAKKTNFRDFALQTEIYEETDVDLYPLMNILLDVFVDYHTFTHNELYPYLQHKIFKTLKDKDIFEEDVQDQESLIDLIMWYIVFYIHFHYCLKESDRKKREDSINQRISYIRKNLLEFNPDMNVDKLDKLNKALDWFYEIKDSDDPIVITAFTSEVLKSLDFWTYKYIIRQIKLYYLELIQKVNEIKRSKGE